MPVLKAVKPPPDRPSPGAAAPAEKSQDPFQAALTARLAARKSGGFQDPLEAKKKTEANSAPEAPRLGLRKVQGPTKEAEKPEPASPFPVQLKKVGSGPPPASSPSAAAPPAGFPVQLKKVEPAAKAAAPAATPANTPVQLKKVEPTAKAAAPANTPVQPKKVEPAAEPPKVVERSAPAEQQKKKAEAVEAAQTQSQAESAEPIQKKAEAKGASTKRFVPIILALVVIAVAVLIGKLR
jgi:hypothetical protein